MVETVTSADQLRPEAYLAVNPDVKAAQLDAHYHFATYGHAEGRKQAVDPDLIRSMRVEKLELLYAARHLVLLARTLFLIFYPQK